MILSIPRSLALSAICLLRKLRKLLQPLFDLNRAIMAYGSKDSQAVFALLASRGQCAKSFDKLFANDPTTNHNGCIEVPVSQFHTGIRPELFLNNQVVRGGNLVQLKDV